MMKTMFQRSHDKLEQKLEKYNKKFEDLDQNTKSQNQKMKI